MQPGHPWRETAMLYSWECRILAELIFGTISETGMLNQGRLFYGEQSDLRAKDICNTAARHGSTDANIPTNDVYCRSNQHDMEERPDLHTQNSVLELYRRLEWTTRDVSGDLCLCIHILRLILGYAFPGNCAEMVTLMVCSPPRNLLGKIQLLTAGTKHSILYVSVSITQFQSAKNGFSGDDPTMLTRRRQATF